MAHRPRPVFIMVNAGEVKMLASFCKPDGETRNSQMSLYPWYVARDHVVTNRPGVTTVQLVWHAECCGATSEVRIFVHGDLEAINCFQFSQHGQPGLRYTSTGGRLAAFRCFGE